MKRYRFAFILTFLIGVPLIAGCAEMTAQKPEMEMEEEAEMAPAVSGPTSALDACLAKIPTDATEGQRLLAKQSCLRANSDLTAVTGKDSPAGTVGSAGSASDSLQACLDRIPDDATAGQRLLAEQSCLRDEANR